MSEVIDPRSTTTPILGLKLPDVGGDIDVWGGEINGNFTILDGALMRSGGGMTGPILVDPAGVNPPPMQIRNVGDTATVPYVPQMMLNISSDHGAARLDMVNGGGGNIILGRSSGGSIGAPTAIQTGILLNLAGGGYDGAEWVGGKAVITLGSEDFQTWTPASTPTKIQFAVTPIGSNASREVMRLNGAGQLLIGATAPNGSEKLRVAGGVYLDHGLAFVDELASDPTDLSQHINLFAMGPGVGYGLSVTPNRQNYVVPNAAHYFVVNGVDMAHIDSAGLTVAGGGLSVVGGAAIDTLTAPLFQPTGQPLTITANYNVPSSGIPNSTPFWIVGADGQTLQAYLDAYGGPAVLVGRRANGNATAPQIIANPDQGILQLDARGWIGSDFSQARGRVSINTAHAWSATDNSTYIAFQTTAIGTLTTSEKARLTDAGALLVGATAPVGTERLRIVGGAAIDQLNVINGTAPLIVNASGATKPATWPPNVSIVVTRDNGFNSLALMTGGTTSSGTAFNGYRSGGTLAAPTATPPGVGLTAYNGGGYDGASWFNKAQINMVSAAQWAVGDNGTYITFSTTQIGTATQAERMRLTDQGALLVGAPTPVGSERLLISNSAGDAGIQQQTVGINYHDALTASGTLAAPTAVAGGQTLFSLRGGGYDSAAWQSARAAIVMQAVTAWTGSNTPTALSFQTCPASTNAVAYERMRLNSEGQLLLNAGAPNSNEKLRVVGGVNVDVLFNGALGTAPVMISNAGQFGTINTGVGGYGTNTALYIQAGQNVAMTIDVATNVGVQGPTFRGRSARGSLSVPDAATSATQFACFEAQAYDGAAFQIGAQILMRSVETWSGTARGTAITFLTNAATTTTLSEKLRVTDAGALQFAVTGPSISVGAGAPATVTPNGSIFLRTDGTTGARLYVSNGATWAPVAGV